MELRFNLGNGPIVLRSLQPIRLGQWHRVMAQRYRQDGWLRLDDDEDVATTSPGEHSSLDLDTNTYLGAVPSHLATARYAARISNFFNGSTSMGTKFFRVLQLVFSDSFEQKSRSHRYGFGLRRLYASCQDWKTFRSFPRAGRRP